MTRQRKEAPKRRKVTLPARNEPHPIDLCVGLNIRNCRLDLGMTQNALAKKVGITAQQIQKYETAYNRLSASRLWLIAEALGINVLRLYENMDKFERKEEHNAINRQGKKKGV